MKRAYPYLVHRVQYGWALSHFFFNALQREHAYRAISAIVMHLVPHNKGLTRLRNVTESYDVVNAYTRSIVVTMSKLKADKSNAASVSKVYFAAACHGSERHYLDRRNWGPSICKEFTKQILIPKGRILVSSDSISSDLSYAGYGTAWSYRLRHNRFKRGSDV